MIKSLLIVEDEIKLRLLLASYLGNRFQAEINAVGTLKDAMKLMQLKKYCVVISDLNLPDGKGTSLFSLSPPTETHFILFSGQLTETNFKKNKEFYEIPKPNFTQLLKVLNQIARE